MKIKKDNRDKVLGNIPPINVQELKQNETESDEKIGNLIRHFRKLNGVTQMELAVVAGISAQQIQKYEKGADRIAFSRLITLLDFLHIDLDDFMKAMKLSLQRQV